jgi:hypothetical protein
MRGLLFVLCAGSAVAAIPNAVKDEFVPSPYEQTRIGGLLGGRMKINLEKRLLRVDEKALVEGFQTRPGSIRGSASTSENIFTRAATLGATPTTRD